MEEKVVLVDEKDNKLGIEEKLAAHKSGALHRAFSIFIYNSAGEMLLQQRADSKYHSGGMWTNACCSHPRLNEDVEQAAHRRLQEEMGFDCALKKLFDFIYFARLDQNLIEHEFDHVFSGTYDGKIYLNPSEAKDYKWINIDSLKSDIKKNPQQYTVWFKIAFNKLKSQPKN